MHHRKGIDAPHLKKRTAYEPLHVVVQPARSRAHRHIRHSRDLENPDLVDYIDLGVDLVVHPGPAGGI